MILDIGITPFKNIYIIVLKRRSFMQNRRLSYKNFIFRCAKTVFYPQMPPRHFAGKPLFNLQVQRQWTALKQRHLVSPLFSCYLRRE